VVFSEDTSLIFKETRVVQLWDERIARSCAWGSAASWLMVRRPAASPLCRRWTGA